MCSTPAGRSACSNKRAITAPPHTAVRGSGLSTTALPSAIAGATARIARYSGKLNGEMIPTTPSGRRRARFSRPGSEGRISPTLRDGSAAASCSALIVTLASKPALRRVEPLSRTSQSMRVSMFSSASRAALRSTSARCSYGAAAHARCACAAVAAERATCAGSARPISPSDWPVAGSITGCRCTAACQCPSKKAPAQRASGSHGEDAVMGVLLCRASIPRPSPRAGNRPSIGSAQRFESSGISSFATVQFLHSGQRSTGTLPTMAAPPATCPP